MPLGSCQITWVRLPGFYIPKGDRQNGKLVRLTEVNQMVQKCFQGWQGWFQPKSRVVDARRSVQPIEQFDRYHDTCGGVYTRCRELLSHVCGRKSARLAGKIAYKAGQGVDLGRQTKVQAYTRREKRFVTNVGSVLVCRGQLFFESVGCIIEFPDRRRILRIRSVAGTLDSERRKQRTAT